MWRRKSELCFLLHAHTTKMFDMFIQFSLLADIFVVLHHPIHVWLFLLYHMCMVILYGYHFQLIITMIWLPIIGYNPSTVFPKMRHCALYKSHKNKNSIQWDSLEFLNLEALSGTQGEVDAPKKICLGGVLLFCKMTRETFPRSWLVCLLCAMWCPVNSADNLKWVNQCAPNYF